MIVQAHQKLYLKCNGNCSFALTTLPKKGLGASYCIYAITALVQFFIALLFFMLYSFYVSRHIKSISSNCKKEWKRIV